MNSSEVPFPGLFILAVTDSLLGYFSLSPAGFNTGTLQDILWPLSMLLIGLSAIEYPRCIGREQTLAAGGVNPALPDSLVPAMGRFKQISTILQASAPFLLALLTSTVLLTKMNTRGVSWSFFVFCPIVNRAVSCNNRQASMQWVGWISGWRLMIFGEHSI